MYSSSSRWGCGYLGYDRGGDPFREWGGGKGLRRRFRRMEGGVDKFFLVGEGVIFCLVCLFVFVALFCFVVFWFFFFGR